MSARHAIETHPDLSGQKSVITLLNRRDLAYVDTDATRAVRQAAQPARPWMTDTLRLRRPLLPAAPIGATS